MTRPDVDATLAALVFVDKYLVSGAQPYEPLVQVVEQVAEERPEL